MKSIDEYRDAKTARQYADAIAQLTTRPWTIMEVCGGQTHAIVFDYLKEMDELAELQAGEPKTSEC